MYSITKILYSRLRSYFKGSGIETIYGDFKNEDPYNYSRYPDMNV